MISKISTERINSLYPGLRPMAYKILTDVFEKTGRALNVVQATRSFSDQLAVYSKGRTFVGGVWRVVDSGKVVSNARPGLSWHCYGLAFDCAWAGMDPYLKNEKESEREILWNIYGQIVENYGLRWGGKSFRLLNGVRDLPHAELSYGLTIDQALELYGEKGVDSVWAYIDAVRQVPEGQD